MLIKQWLDVPVFRFRQTVSTWFRYGVYSGSQSRCSYGSVLSHSHSPSALWVLSLSGMISNRLVFARLQKVSRDATKLLVLLFGSIEWNDFVALGLRTPWTVTRSLVTEVIISFC